MPDQNRTRHNSSNSESGANVRKQTAVVKEKPRSSVNHPSVTRLQNGDARTRTISSSSTMSDISYECTVSDIESDDMDSSITDSSSESNLSFTSITEELEEKEEDDASFFTKSCTYYSEQDSIEIRKTNRNAERMLEQGITLNASYMQRFEDRRPEVLDRDNFYPTFLDEAALKQKLLQNPKKYIRCIIRLEGSHEAHCIPIESNLGYSVIEISGRSKIGQVFNEDEVVVEILDNNHTNDKRYGNVLGVLHRQRHRDIAHPVFICTLDDMESHLVRPMCKTVPKIHVLNREIAQKYKQQVKRFKVEIYDYDEDAGILCDPRIIDVNPAGQKTYVFLVAFISWGPRHIYPRGAIIKALPWGSSVQSGLAILNLQHQVPSLYSKNTVDRMEAIMSTSLDEPDENALKGRIDLTQMNTFTIDPRDSKDLDDALSIEPLDGGYKVGVHIADVSHFVEKDDLMDVEAMQRATTYYPGIRKPRHMLPEPLSANRCSLLPGKIRLTLSIFFYLTGDGKPMQMEGQNFKVCQSYIKTKERFSYGEVQGLLFGESQQQTPERKLFKDIHQLYKLAKRIRQDRLGRAMFGLDTDWEENLEEESLQETREAHYLVEEFMIMANRKVAEVLVRKYPKVIPIRCQPPPSQDGIEQFLKKNNRIVDVLVRLQGRQIAGQRRGVEFALSNQSSNVPDVLVPTDIWRKMNTSPESAVRCLQQDDLFPLQHVVYQHWLSIQERADYRCSGSVNGQDTGKHFSLGFYPYTHFTSPIRRYNDLVIHRLLKAILKQESCPYTKNEMDDICTHMNFATRRQKEYQRGCKGLQKGLEFNEREPMLSCFVDDVSDRGVTFCSPLLRYVKKTNRELSFNVLDMGFKPEVFEDKKTSWDSVKATWRRRVYDHKGMAPNYPPDRGHSLTINPHKHVLKIALNTWARLLLAASENRFGDVKRSLASADEQPHGTGLDDISTECYQLEYLQPNTKFSMTFSRGQTVAVQMSAEQDNGMMVPKPMMYKMSNNVQFCLQHTDDPVLHLYRYVTKSTCKQYRHVQDYLERWVPLILMEAATGISRNEESCCINNVPIKFNDRVGKFALSLAHCDTRNIELSGTQSDDEEESNDDADNNSYDWLCLKGQIPLTGHSSSETERKGYWVGHAEVKSVKRKRPKGEEGKLSVTFQLHERAKAVPHELLHGKEATFNVEILRKTEVDR